MHLLHWPSIQTLPSFLPWCTWWLAQKSTQSMPEAPVIFMQSFMHMQGVPRGTGPMSVS